MLLDVDSQRSMRFQALALTGALTVARSFLSFKLYKVSAAGCLEPSCLRKRHQRMLKYPLQLWYSLGLAS